MTNVLLSECVTDNASVLVHGCGGGLELEAFANHNPTWILVGVDPAKPMLDEASARLSEHMDRVFLHHGFIDTAPSGPFDAATSLLTLHFLPTEERVATIRKIAERLKPGAPFIAVHSSFPQDESARALWMSRYEAFAVASGVDPDMAQNARQAVEAMTTIYEPEQDMNMMTEAGLERVSLFYTGFTWAGWVGYAPD